MRTKSLDVRSLTPGDAPVEQQLNQSVLKERVEASRDEASRYLEARAVSGCPLVVADAETDAVQAAVDLLGNASRTMVKFRDRLVQRGGDAVSANREGILKNYGLLYQAMQKIRYPGNDSQFERMFDNFTAKAREAHESGDASKYIAALSVVSDGLRGWIGESEKPKNFKSNRQNGALPVTPKGGGNVEGEELDDLLSLVDEPLPPLPDSIEEGDLGIAKGAKRASDQLPNDEKIPAPKKRIPQSTARPAGVGRDLISLSQRDLEDRFIEESKTRAPRLVSPFSEKNTIAFANTGVENFLRAHKYSESSCRLAQWTCLLDLCEAFDALIDLAKKEDEIGPTEAKNSFIRKSLAFISGGQTDSFVKLCNETLGQMKNEKHVDTQEKLRKLKATSVEGERSVDGHESIKKCIDKEYSKVSSWPGLRRLKFLHKKSPGSVGIVRHSLDSEGVESPKGGGESNELEAIRGDLCKPLDKYNGLLPFENREKKEIARDIHLMKSLYRLEIDRDDCNMMVLQNVMYLFAMAYRDLFPFRQGKKEGELYRRRQKEFERLALFFLSSAERGSPALAQSMGSTYLLTVLHSADEIESYTGWKPHKTSRS